MKRSEFIQQTGLAGMAMVTGEYMLEKLNIEFNFHEIGEKKTAEKPIKLVQVSDLHLVEITQPHRKMVSKINELKPDLILFTGDSIDDHKNFDLLKDFLRLFDMEIPKAAVMGNWDYATGIGAQKFREMYNEFNIKLLVNENITYKLASKNALTIVGVDDLKLGSPNIKKALEGTEPDSSKIILSHCPAYRDFISEYIIINKISADYLFAGHTHGGQIAPFGIVTVLPRGSGKYVKGWYTEKYPHMYVSKGIGTSILPVRIGVRPEVAVFNLHI